MGRHWLLHGGAGSVTQYSLVLLGIKWYWVTVSKVLFGQYMEKNGDLVGCYRSLTH